MRILAIESSTRLAAAGLYQCDTSLSVDRDQFLEALFLADQTNQLDQAKIRQISVFNTDPLSPNGDAKSASSTLLPGIKQLFQPSPFKLSATDLLTVALGPGSFTGLRLGVVAAKTIAYATSCPIIGINVAEGLAYQSLPYLQTINEQRISVGINIGRREILASDYLYDRQKRFQLTTPPSILNAESWLEHLTVKSLPCTGSGIDLLSSAHPPLKFAPGPQRQLSIESVAKLGWFQFQEQGATDFWGLEPIYSRPSAAEEKRMSSNQN